MRVDPRAWLFWVLVMAAISSLSRNPLYLIVVLLVLGIVANSCTIGARSSPPLSLWRFALVVIPLTALFNGLMVHSGETVLLRLPAVIPVIGGPVTLEALVYGTTNGLALTVLFAAFTTIVQVVPVHELVKLTPRAFHEAGVVLSIALAFLPQTSRNIERIRQAQAIRGHRPRGVRDWLPILLPLLITGLERGMGLAEAMVARGYGSVSGRPQDFRLRLGLVLGLLLLLVGWVLRAFVPAWSTAGLALMGGGAGLLILLLWWAGTRVKHTRYRLLRWRWWDTCVVAGSGLAFLLMTLPGLPRATLHYYPYPRISLPGFEPIIGLGLLGLLLPVLGCKRGEDDSI